MIVEGPDGAGKTTLLTRLSRDLGVPIKEWPEARNEMANVGVFRRVFSSLAYEVSASNAEPPLLHDRLYLSELVYGSVLRGKVAFDVYQQNTIEDIILALRIPVILCRPPWEIVAANVAASQGTQMEGVPDHIRAIWEAYGGICTNRIPKPHSILYDYTGATRPSSSYERILSRCEKYLTYRSKRTWQS